MRGTPAGRHCEFACTSGMKNGKQGADAAEALTFSLTAEEVVMLDQATLAWRK